MGDDELRCPKCKGWAYLEWPISKEGYVCRNYEEYGIDLVCTNGHRFVITPEKIKEILMKGGRIWLK